MAQRKAEIWLTSVVENESVDNAVVLAESLRKTKTTRNIAVIASRNVSLDKRAILHKTFDVVFYIEECHSFDHSVKAETEDLQAKIFAFSMYFFEKCVFISSNSLVLENIDNLFEGKMGFKSLASVKDGSIDFSLFMIAPNCDLWENFRTSLCHNGNILSEDYLRKWLKNQSGAMKMDKISENVLVQLSLKTGRVSNFSEHGHAPIVQFVDVQKGIQFYEQLGIVQSLNTGLYEKLITTSWLDTYGNVIKLLNNPYITRSPASSPANNPIYLGNEPIAIIGMSCRYPGANTLDEFWSMLYEGEEGVREPPAFRWTKEHSLRVSPQERKTNAGFLSTTVDEFDARFFGVSPKEACYMDPQTRLLHEVVWESLEDSGIDPSSLHGTHTGIFTGSWMNDYKDIVQGSTEQDFFRTYMGNSIGAGAARLSFLLGVTGPSIATESGCSSAIVAVDLAVKSLRSKETNLAMAAGVNLLLHPYTSSIMDYVIAPNGRCKTFDSKADGFGRAEGCGVLVLKRLGDALRDRDNIWAVIRGSAVSQEGLSRSLGTPTVHCEALAMQLALEDAGVRPSQVSFVETHGTGTAVGDPMEVAAIAKAYYSQDRKDPLIIGSVKTNVGHTESCSGITGIMKMVLALQHELIPKHRNLESLNPEIFLDSIPARLPLEPLPWLKVKGQVRIGGVSSFGITGTDGHVIIQEPPDYQLPKFTLGLERPQHIIKICGKTSQALDELVERYEKLFGQKVKQDNSFADVAYSGNIGRATFPHRAFIIAGNYQDAVKAFEEKRLLKCEVKDIKEAAHQICFLFTGQGCQYQGMAKTLYDTSPIFRLHFDACDRLLQDLYNLSIRPVLWQSSESSCSSNLELSRTIYSQTSIFCIEYCLWKLWQSWGIQPDFVLGHSLGEFAASVCAGILTFEDALKLVAERSRLIDNLPRGSMLVIKASKPEVEKLMIEGKYDLEVAAVNHPEQTVVAGDTEKIELFLQFLKGRGETGIILDATHAFHSRHMDPMLQQYRKIAETINYKKGDCRVHFISGMEGRLCESSEINADYWVRHTRDQVNFIDACTALRAANVEHFLELGPHPILSTFVMMNNPQPQMTCFPSLRRGSDEWQTILNSLGKLYLLGYNVDWQGFDRPYIRNKVSLPFHPFNRKSFWVQGNNGNINILHPLLGFSLNNASNLNMFQNDLSLITVPYLKDHCLGTRIIFPGAGYTEMCLAAGYCVANGITDIMERPERPLLINNLRIDAPLELKEGKGCRLQVIVNLPPPPQSSDEPIGGGFLVKVFHQNTNSDDSAKWVLHASTTFVPVPSTKTVMTKWEPQRIKKIISTVQPTSATGFYKRVDDSGLKFGETFRGILKHWDLKQEANDSDEIIAQVALPTDHNKYILHPLIIDAAFQSAILTGIKHDLQSKLKVPVRIGSLLVLNTFERDTSPHNSFFIQMWSKTESYSGFIFTADFTPIAYLDNVELIDTNVRTIESVLEQQSSSMSDAWEEVWRAIPLGPYTNICELTSIAPILSEPSLQREIALLTESKAEKVEIIRKTNRLLYLYILNTLYKLGWEPQLHERIKLTQFCQKFHILPQFRQLVHFYFTCFQEEHIMQFNNSCNQWKLTSIPPLSTQNKPEIETLTAQLKLTTSRIVVSIYEHVYSHLPAILKGAQSPLSILFPTEPEKVQFSAEVYYQGHPSRQDSSGFGYCIVSSILKALQKLNVSKRPAQAVVRVLEVGSGTGSMSQHSLKCLREVWGDNFEYYYTDISQSFFGRAEKKFEEFGKNMKFAVFNVEESPLSQGIPLNYFDFVLATDVLHATRSLQECLVHIRQTMRAKAALFFMETIIAARDITYLFGLLEGYWRFEDFHLRPHHVCVSVYEGVFGSITAEADENVEVASLMTCSSSLVIDTRLAGDRNGWWIVFGLGPDRTTLEVANTIYSSGYRVLVVFKSCQENEEGRTWLNGNIDRITITGNNKESVEIDGILSKDNLTGILYGWGRDLNNFDQEQVALPFMHIAKWSFGQKRLPLLYILTRGVHSINESLGTNPTAATLFGMAKSLKNENSEFFVRYVDLENEEDWRKPVNQVLYELSMCRGSKEGGRIQIVYRDGQRFEPKFVKSTTVATKQDQLQLPPSSERYHLVLPETRLIQDVTFDIDEGRDVGDNEVEVKVKGYALNFRDIFAILKPIKQFEGINAVGLDFAGVVVKVGRTAGKWKVGDRVFGANFKEDQLPSHLVVEGDSVLRIPKNMTFWEASTLPAVFATSYYCLLTVANMKMGDVVLIHTGSGGVGLAAIQLARHVGAMVISTAGNARKREYLRSLGIEHVFHSRNTSYEQDILRVTKGRGVDIVLNSITGPGFKEASLASCAKNGRFVEMSKLAIWSKEEVKVLRPDVHYTVVDLTSLEHEEWTSLLDKMTDYLDQGVLKPIPYVKFDALHIRQALQFFQKAKHVGKVVCVMPEVVMKDGQIKEFVPLFNNESTYLITGGLGGIGFEVCKWMLEKGASDIVLTARNAPKPEVAAAIKELNKRKGSNVMVRLGDVSDLDQCKSIIVEISKDLKPLRGVMHCAGVLRDNMYSNQTWQDFEATYKPKVGGTWNLHNLTRNMQLEHFVLYSSLTALVGTPTQPNHSSANSFEDGFAHYRHSLGLPATTINWGQWAQVGCAKEVTFIGVLPVSVRRMLNGLEMAMRTQTLQISFSEFESFANLSLICPTTRSYIDDKLWNKPNNEGGNERRDLLNSEEFWTKLDGIVGMEGKLEKIKLVGNYLKIILRIALRLDGDEPISEDVNIQDIGVDSLMLIELKNSIQSLLGSRIAVTAGLLKNCNTIRQIAASITERILEDCGDDDDAVLGPLSVEELSQLVQNDCQLDDSIRNHKKCGIFKASNVRTVLLTGSTGQLGGTVLAELSTKYRNVQNIVCMVRDVEGITVQKRVADRLEVLNLKNMVDMSKVECVRGDVTKLNLGMDLLCYERLVERVDAVIHLAAKTNYSEPYRNYEDGKMMTTRDDVRSVNVNGTVNILKFACDRNIKQVYFASTLMCGIFGENESGGLSDDWLDMDVIRACIDAKLVGEQMSKFVVELLIKEASLRGIPCKVFRFPWIAGHSKTGRLDYRNNLYILRYLSFLKVNAMPKLAFAFPANLLPIDLCAELSLELFFNDNTPFEIFNVGHPHPQVEEEFVRVAKQEFGKELDIVEWQEFAERLEGNDTQIESMKDLYKDQKSMSMYIAEAVGFVNGYQASPDNFFMNEKLARFIPSFKGKLEPTMEMVRRDLRYLKAIGFLDKFGV